jgi:uncharacterized protein (TIGR02231 family)
MVEIATEISEVSVYTDRARVTRLGKAYLEAGEHTLTIDGLPSTLQEETVRASGRGANARILSVEVQTRYVTEEPEEDIAALRKELEAKTDEDKALADTDAQEASQQAYLNELREESARNLPRGIAQGKTGIESLSSLNEYVERQLSEVAERRREIAKRRRDLSREIEALQMRLNARHVTMERRQIAVLVEATEATDLELEVTYGVYNASWEPLYDLRLEGDKVNLTYLANVRQHSGEEWSNVMLSLSTARPAVSADIPELDPWFIDIYRPPVPMPMAARSAAKEAVYAMAEPSGPYPQSAAMAMDMAAPTPPPMEIMQAQVESTGASVTFRVPKRVSVPPDGTPHKTTITMLDMEARLDYVTVPKIAEEAYLRARISNNSQLTLLSGSANIFHEGNYVGRTFLETVAPNEEFEAQLGVDDRVKVKRELSERTAGKTLIGNTRRTGLGYKITLHNHLEREAQVTVYDQVPVSRHENIKVRVAEVTPEPAEHTDLNIMKWNLTLAPGAKREVRFSYQVESPRDVQISNLRE